MKINFNEIKLLLILFDGMLLCGEMEIERE
jgi:hypothetical protein